MNTSLAKSFGLGSLIAIIIVAGVVSAELTLGQQGGSYSCPVLPAFPYSFSSSGFVMSERIGRSNDMQFVIAPNSTASLEINYSVGLQTAETYANRSEYFVPVPSWAKLGDSSPSPMSASEVGLHATPIRVDVTGNHTLAATYQVTASATALDGAYVGYFWSTCGPQIVLTVGNSFYRGYGLEGGIYF